MLRLDVDGAFVDALTFDAALARGDLDSLAEAVRLYRGRLLEDCSEAWILEERQRREQDYVAALGQLAAAATARREHAAAASYLRRAIGADPYREDLHRALMEALAADGNPAGALLAYRQFRALLWRDMTAEPAEETTALFRRLREETRARAKPRVLKLPVAATPRSASSRCSVAPGPKGNLPQPLSAFVGRERELLEVSACFDTARLVTLTGIGGIGKTRLALRVADACAGEYPDGIWFVDLAALADPALVPQAVARALRVPEAPGSPLTETLQTALGARQLLLVLDNCEHLLDACARLAEALLCYCPHLRLLATSRQALGLTGEIAWPVPPLSLPEPPESIGHPPLTPPPTRKPIEQGAEEWTSAPLLDSEAVRLFVERAGDTASGFTLTERNAAATVQVCRRLDGIPLAIELAAARLRALSIEHLAARLDDRFRLLTGGSRTALPRQQTLRATIDWSYDLLSEAERVVMRRLSVFAGGWTLEAAEAVCAGDPIPEGELLDLLTSLVEKSLVVYKQQEGGARYWLLETVRQYFSEQLLEAGEREATRERHLEYFLALAEEAEPQLTGPQQGEWLARLETEHDNLRVALAFSSSDHSDRTQSALRHRTGEMGLRLAGALWRFWSVRGYMTEGRERLAQALASTPGATAARAKALETAGSLAYRQADYQSARTLQEESLAIRRALEDWLGIAASLRNLGSIAHAQGDHVVARTLHEESLAISRELGNRWGIAASLNHLGSVVFRQGEYGAARSLHEESLAIRRELGDRVGIAGSLSHLGSLAHLRGECGAARSLWEESLAIHRELGNRPGIASSLHNLGTVAYQQGEYEAARSLYEQCAAIRRELGDRSGIAASLDDLGTVAYWQGDYEAARSLYEESLAIDRELGDRSGIASSLHNLGNVACQQGDHEAARSLYEEGLAIKREFGYRGGVADSLDALGDVAHQQGEYEAARSLQQESLAIRRELGDRLGIAASLEALAALACEGEGQRGAGEGAGARVPAVETADRAAAAAQLYGAAAALREAIGAPLPPSEQGAYRRQECRARELLGEEAFVTAWAEGRAMTLDQAVAYALEGTGSPLETGR